MKIVNIVGARPQFIKAAAVSRVLRLKRDLEDVLVHTGQHYDENMSEIFYRELDIPDPKYNLRIGSGEHGRQTGRMLEAIEKVLLQEKPDWVLVYGDTNTTLAGGLSAAKLHMPLAHIEAGLRSFRREMPEEVNRLVTDHVSDLLFCPTYNSVENLRREGIDEERIFLSGDVMYDAALYYGEIAEKSSRILQQLGLEKRGYILATVHRAENTDCTPRLTAIINGFVKVAKKFPVVFPVHPRTWKALKEAGLLSKAREACIIISAVGYLDMMMLEKSARLIATDSGGVQKEAFFYRVPCVTIRAETEWQELVELGWNRICFPQDGKSVAEAIMVTDGTIGVDANPYGEGDASNKIVKHLSDWVR